MSDQILQYIRNQQALGYQMAQTKSIDSNGKPLPTRFINLKVKQYIKNFLINQQQFSRWLVMPGLRGTGKTTVLAQTQIWLSNNNNFSKKINLISISADEIVNRLNADINQFLAGYELILGVHFSQLKRPTFIFIDEIQADPNWAQVLKSVYDKAPNIFLFCTGSSAVNLQVDADVAGRRAQIEKLFPLSFPEFKILKDGIYPTKGLKNRLIEALYYSDSSEKAFRSLKALGGDVNLKWSEYGQADLESYLTVGTMPFALERLKLGVDQKTIYQHLTEIIEKIVTVDLRTTSRFKYFAAGTELAFRRLLFLLADSDGRLSLAKINNLIGVNQTQLGYMFEALVKSELLVKASATGGSATIVSQPARYNFMSPALRNAYFSIVGDLATSETRRGWLLEDLAALHYYRELYSKNRGLLTHFYDKKDKQCDFILQIANSHRLAIEFGLGQKDIRQVVRTMKQIKCRYGIIFSKNRLKHHQAESIVIVPLDYFYLI